MTKPSTNPSAEEPQIPNKMELIKHPTDMIEFLYGKVSRDLGSGFVVVKLNDINSYRIMWDNSNHTRTKRDKAEFE